MKPLLTIGLAISLLATACGGGADTAVSEPPEPASEPADPAGEPAGEPASDPAEPVNSAWPFTFVADQVDGGIFDAGDYAGQDLVLWFWAPW